MNDAIHSYNRRKRWYDCMTAPMTRLAKWILLFIFLGLAVTIAFVSIYAWRASDYDMREVPKRVACTQALADEKQNLGSPFNRNGISIKYEQLPPDLVKALIAREDESYASHNGIDFTAILRSFWRNAVDMSFTQGGSTLSMQLARNVFELRAKSLDRKFLEIAIALRIERHYSKEEILESYLNRVYFGAGAYGIGDAAQTFFRKSVSELTLGESALLVGIIRGPSIYNPFTSEKLAIRQRDEVLDRMLDAGFLTEEQAGEEKVKAMLFAPNDMNLQPSYPLQWIRREMAKAEKLTPREMGEAGQKVGAEETGMYLLTSFNLPLQRYVERTAELSLQKLEKTEEWPLPKREEDGEKCLQAAILVLRPNTGDVLALVGGRDSLDGKNLWTDIDRQVGSLFSPVVFSAVSDASQFIVRGDPYQSSRDIDEKVIRDLAQKAGMQGELPQGRELVDGLFKQKMINMIPMLLSLHNGGYAPQLHSITTAFTPKGAILYETTHPRLSGTTPLLPPEAARVVYKMTPFMYDEASKVTTIRSTLPENQGFFVGRIHSKLAVFVWVGQVIPESSVYESAKFNRLLANLAGDLSNDMLGFVIPLPKMEPPPPPSKKVEPTPRVKKVINKARPTKSKGASKQKNSKK